MRPEVRFALKAFVGSVGLFGVWWWLVIVTGEGHATVVDGAGFCVPVLASILASELDRTRRTIAAAGLLLLYVVGELVFAASGMRVVAETGRVPEDTLLWHVAAAAYHAFRLGLPVAVLVAATGGDLRRLWRRSSAGTRGANRRCPECGRRKVGLEAHIRDVHGREALDRARRRGLL